MKKEKWYYVNSALTIDIYIVDKIENGKVYGHSEILTDLEVDVYEKYFDTEDHSVFWSLDKANEKIEKKRKENENKSWDRLMEEILEMNVPLLDDVINKGEIIKEKIVYLENKKDKNGIKICHIVSSLYKMNNNYYIISFAFKQNNTKECLIFKEAWINEDYNSFGLKNRK